MPPEAVLSEPQIDNADGVVLNLTADADATETQEWLDALDAVIETAGPQRAFYLLTRLQMEAHRHGVRTPAGYNTPFINSIPAEDQPPFPGDRKIERDIKSLVRWNAMAMVARGHNGGHISTYASAATLYEIGLQPLLPRPRRPRRRGHGLHPGPCLARHLRPRLPRRPAERAQHRELPPRTGRPAAGCRAIRILG